MGLDELVLLGKGEESSGGRAKASILADCFEAVIGACYLQGGLERARAVILRELSTSMKEAARAPGREDYKTRLQELVTQRFQDAPVYELSEWGPDHSKRFGATVIVAGEVLGYGEGPSKKEAQQRAAQQGWCRLTEGLGLPDAPRGQEATAEHEGMEEGGA
jgi:ribonuclease-3